MDGDVAIAGHVADIFELLRTDDTDRDATVERVDDLRFRKRPEDQQRQSDPRAAQIERFLQQCHRDHRHAIRRQPFRQLYRAMSVAIRLQDRDEPGALGQGPRDYIDIAFESIEINERPGRPRFDEE